MGMDTGNEPITVILYPVLNPQTSMSDPYLIFDAAETCIHKQIHISLTGILRIMSQMIYRIFWRFGYPNPNVSLGVQTFMLQLKN